MAGWKDKRKIMQRYDLTAEIYNERYGEEQKAKYEATLKNAKIDNQAVLDVGCGSGLFFSEAAPTASIVIGVDISRKLLLKAKERASAFSNVFIFQADADHLPFDDQLFDVAVAFTVLQNMPKPLATLNELKRVTRLDGRVVVTGLKKAFSLEKFLEMLDSASFKVDSLVDDEELKCYVGLLART